ncbi:MULTISPECIES: hypothetical protein [unclassified Bradyrhizobium]|uniref:hypothetical protein n=1 Tax=unclassified Bradyrhizobium TaxID=2631580 RepID=UPI0029160D52|nr:MULTISPECIES: hypothetical protein [unclassified Bradyrhizobium]
MADIVLQRSVAELTSAAIGSAFTAVTAGGAGDATAVTGYTIDRMGFGNGSLPQSAELVLAYQATLAATKTLSLGTVKVEQSSDGSNWDSTAYLAFTDPGVVATGKTGGSTEKGALKLSVPLTSAKRFIRADFTPDLSNTATDTATVVAVWNLAGFDRLPAP